MYCYIVHSFVEIAFPLSRKLSVGYSGKPEYSLLREALLQKKKTKQNNDLMYLMC